MKNRQTRLHQNIIKFYKLESIKRDVILSELYEEAIEFLLMKRDGSPGTILYMASPKKGKELNVSLHTSLFDRIEKVIAEDGTSMRRFIFTALFTYEQICTSKETS